MKTSALLILIFVNTVLSSPNGINIILEDHHVYGYARDGYYGPIDKYDFTSATPVSGSAQQASNTASGSAGNFNVTASSSGTDYNAYAYSESSYVFKPQASLLSLSAFGFVGNDPDDNIARIQLRDITIYSDLMYYDSLNWVIWHGKVGDEHGFSIQLQQDFQVDPMHLYQLYMYAKAYNSSYGNGGGTTYLNSVVTPEPATIVFLVLGILVLHLRKAFHKFLVSCILLFGMLPVADAAYTGINILSQTHHVSGYAGNTYSGAYDSYNITDSIPVSGSVRYYIRMWNTASSSAGDFSVSASHGGDGGQSVGFAESTYVFNPISLLLALTVNGYVGEWPRDSPAILSLTDLTSSVSLENSNSNNWMRYPPLYPGTNPFHWQKYYLVDPTHEYKLWYSARAGNSEGGGGSTAMTVLITPEPATVLLLALGGMLVRGSKKRFGL